MTAKLTHPTAPLVINRRDFLGLGIAFSASLFLPIALKTMSQRSTNSADAPNWTVGFLPFSDPDQAFVSADRLSSGDPVFLDRGAQLTLHHLYVPDNSPLTAMTVNAHYYPEGVPEAIQVPVWSYRRTPITSLGATNRIAVPVSQAQGLTLSLDWQAGDRQTLTSKFAVDRTPNQLKLQRGTYLIAGQDPQFATLPDWSDYRWQTGSLQGRDRASTTPFPYLLLTIDYGNI
jgi:hypothetical protein